MATGADGTRGAGSRQAEPSLAARVLTTTAVLTFATASVRLLSIVTAPILTAALGPAPYGVVALAGTATILLSTLAMSGIGAGYTRSLLADLVQDRDAAERFCWRFSLAATCAVSALAAIVWFLDLAPQLTVDRDVPLMLALGVLATNANLMATIRCRLLGAYRRIALAAIANGVVGSGTSIALALWWRPDAWALFLGTTIGAVVGFAMSGGVPWRTVSRPSGLSKPERRRILAFGAPTAVTTLMYWVLSSSDRWFIGLLSGERELGVYSFAYGVGGLAALLNTAVSQAWLPEVLRSFDRASASAAEAVGAAWARTFAVLAIAWLGVAAAGGDAIRLLAAPEFHEGARYVPWIAAGVFFYGIGHMAATGLMVREDMRPTASWWLVGAVCVLGLNFVLVRRFGAVGAAVSSAIGFSVIAAGILWSAQRSLPLPLPKKRLAAASAVVAAMGLVASQAWSERPIVSLVLKVGPCAVSGAVALQILWPTWLQVARARVTTRRRPGDGAAS